MGNSISMLLFQPPGSTYTSDDERFFQLFTHREQTIGAFYLDEGHSHTILFSHGNAEDIGLVYGWFKEVARILRVNVFAYDYTGYGINDSDPSEEDVYADVEAAMDYLTIIMGIPPKNIVLWGRSLGSGPSTYIAKKQSEKGEPVGGLILQSPLMSAYRIAFHFRFSLLGDKFCNIDMMPHVESPVFIIHGTHDEIVPFHHGQELFMAVQKKYRFNPYWVTDGGHNNIEVLNTQEFFKRLSVFIDVVASDFPAENSSAPHATPSPS